MKNNFKYILLALLSVILFKQNIFGAEQSKYVYRDKDNSSSTYTPSGNQSNSSSKDVNGSSNSTISAGSSALNTPSQNAIKFPGYSKWNVASISGKLKLKGLPVNPNLKIFMRNNALISISVRAILVGEVARFEITPDTLLAVNKLNKTYTKEGIADFLKFYPGGLKDIQELLLGRIIVPGHDLYTEVFESLMEVTYAQGQYNVIPIGEAVIEDVKYGYIVDKNFRPSTLLIFPEQRPDLQISAEYTYLKDGYDILMSLKDVNQQISATLELDNPKWSGEAPDKIDLTKKYTRVSAKEFLRGFGK